MKIKKFITRNRNLINGKKDLRKIISIKKFPVFMGTVKNKISKDKFFDLNFFVSKSTGSVQLNPILPFETIYFKGHNSGKIGKLWSEHHDKFSKFISKFKPRSVFEIGGGHGILSSKYQKNKKVNWTIIEPNPSPVKGSKAKFIKKFFESKDLTKYKSDIIIHSHVLEHVYDPQKFFKEIVNKMTENQLMIFSVPNMEEMVKRNYTNVMNFEHTYFLNNQFLKFLFESNNLQILKKQKFKKDHSLFFAIKKKIFKNKNRKNFHSNEYKINLKKFKRFFENQRKIVNNLNKYKFNKKPLFIFGAHIFTQFLLKFGLDKKKILYILDNDPSKQNKRLYGSTLYVKSPKILSEYVNPIVILKAGVYDKEIKKDIKENINNKTIFI